MFKKKFYNITVNWKPMSFIMRRRSLKHTIKKDYTDSSVAGSYGLLKVLSLKSALCLKWQLTSNIEM